MNKMLATFIGAITVAGLLVVLVEPATAKRACVAKAGQGWALTKSGAQFQSFEIIQQVTGNWPIQTDYISKPRYSCKQGGLGWTCIARAKVCKKR